MAFTLISVSCIDRAGFSLVIKAGICEIRTSSSKTIGRIPQARGLYRITDTKTPPRPTHTANTASKEISINELHRRMGHVNHEDLRQMVEKGMVTGIDLDVSSKAGFCETCVKAKATRKPFPKETKTEYKSYGDKVVSDVWGPAPVKSLGGKQYYLLFKDLFSHEERIYFLKQKGEVFDHYKRYEAWVKVQREGRIAILGSDRGGEFTSKGFSEHLENAGTVRHLTVHDSPASNGVAECANRTLLDGARAMLDASKLPDYLWAEAISHHVWIRNRVPTRSVKHDKTPLELATGHKPDLSNVHPWGCKAWVKRLDVGKLEPRADECRFIGFDSESKGLRVYWPGKNRVSVERDIYFNEKDALDNDEVQIEGETDILTNSNQHQPSHTKTTSQPPPIKAKQPENAPKITDIPNDNSTITQRQRPARRNSLEGLPQFDKDQFGRGKRRRAPASRIDAAGAADGEELVDVEEVIDVDDALSLKGKVPVDQGGVDVIDGQFLKKEIENAMAISEDEPSLKEALNGDEREAWMDAIEAELAQMEKVNAWIPVVPPPDANIIPSRYVFRRKRNETGHVVRYKARLVVKGFKQQFGVDYTDTFAPTICASTLRILLSFAAQKGAAIHQCDVKNAYLNSRLKDDITLYSELPPKYESFRELPPNLKNEPRVASKWLVSVYGSKQGAHDWYLEVKDFFTGIGYSVSAADEAVFYKIEDDKYTIVAAATDDFSIFADSPETANFLIQKQLSERFEISDLGPISWLLGVSITRDLHAHTISLGQQAYVEQIVNRFGLSEARVATTPMEVGIDLGLDSPQVSAVSLTPAEKTKYREMIGCLMYATVMTRPDIAFAVSNLSQYLDTPRTTHIHAVTRVFRYLSGTKELKLVLGGSSSTIVGYSDSDWASQIHRHSISGFAFFVGTGVVSWSSKKQPIITLSSTEAEYVALTHSSKDIIWIHKLLTEFSSIFPLTPPTTLFCDNQGAIRLSKDSTFHGRTKHIDVHFHFIRQTVSQGHISLSYCPTDDMIADTFTKPLARFKFEKFRKLLGVF